MKELVFNNSLLLVIDDDNIVIDIKQLQPISESYAELFFDLPKQIAVKYSLNIEDIQFQLALAGLTSFELAE